ncbi:MAG: undecaprenyldiphospho-muramoylpentapeptide beta-N-acetylglucosaminyltransferase [Pseudomonadota bacterium]
MKAAPTILIAAGGTGGHMVPAHALSEALQERGFAVELASDERGLRFPGLFDGVPTHIMETRPPRFGAGVGALKFAIALRKAEALVRQAVHRSKPAAIVGFGGYPTYPAGRVAISSKVPLILHEQNAVLGRVNRRLAGRASAIALSLPNTLKLPRAAKAKAHVIGNPVRNEIAVLNQQGYPVYDADQVLRLLVIGGSQGARILSEVVPNALRMLPPGLKHRLHVTQQCREDDIKSVREVYTKEKIPAELSTYIQDMAHELASTHLVISRAGASSVAEIASAGRPSILIPFAAATDDHQTANARALKQADAAVVIAESDFSATSLAKAIQKLGNDPKRLTNAAQAARLTARPNAAAALADLVQTVAAKSLGEFTSAGKAAE